MYAARPPSQRRLLLAADPARPDPAAFGRARRLAERWGTGFSLLRSGESAAPMDAHTAAGRIAQAAREGDAGLVVIGTADGQVPALAGGGLVESLMESLPMPLLIVRRPSETSYQDVLVASDLSEASRPALDLATRWFADARFTLFHVHAPADGLLSDSAPPEAVWRPIAERRAQAFLQHPRLDAGTVREMPCAFEYGLPEKRLPGYLKTRGADLVVLGTHGEGRVFRELLGATVKELVRLVDRDMLIVRPSAGYSAQGGPPPGPGV